MLVALLAALTLVPAGFTENPVLDARAAYIAGKPVQVLCATNDSSWQTFLQENSIRPPDGIANGYTPVIGGSIIYLAPETCSPILVRLARRTPNLETLGATLDTLVHESIHARGNADEGQTECAAIRALPTYLVAEWGFKKNSTAWRRMMQGAANYHRRLPAQYHTVC